MTTVAARAPWTGAATRIAGRVAATMIIGLLVGALAVLVLLPRVTHGAALTVLTGSMAPDLPVGSIVVIRPVESTTLRVGDIITYRQTEGSNLVTHRIVAVHRQSGRRSFTVRGDANPVADPLLVPASAIRGKVWFDVPYLGTIRNRLGRGRPEVILLGVLCLSVFSLWQFVGAWRDHRTRA